MKKLLALLFSLFLLSSPSVFADDISDFEIEGISIGDSLLDYMTEEEILKQIELKENDFSYLKEPNKYVQINLNKAFPTYKSGLSFLVKNNSSNQYITNQNEKYRIETIRGAIDYNEDFDGCIAKRNETVKVLSSMFLNAQKTEGDYAHSADPSGSSIVDGVWYTLDSGADISAYCTNHEETFRFKMDWDEGLSIGISSAEVSTWLSDLK